MAVLLTGKPVADALSADTRTRAEACCCGLCRPICVGRRAISVPA